MTEWHITPDYIMDNWTDELFDLMLEKLIERKQRESNAINTSGGKTLEDRSLSAETLAAQSGGMIKVVKQ